MAANLSLWADIMKKIIKEVKESFKDRPLWTVWSLLLCPFAYLFLFLAALFVGLINLSIDDGVTFFKDAL